MKMNKIPLWKFHQKMRTNKMIAKNENSQNDENFLSVAYEMASKKINFYHKENLKTKIAIMNTNFEAIIQQFFTNVLVERIKYIITWKCIKQLFKLDENNTNALRESLQNTTYIQITYLHGLFLTSPNNYSKPIQ